VDPEDPWSHPDAERLDSLSMAAWLRDRGAAPNVVRARDLAMLALSAESIERTSLLAELRKEAAAGAGGFYNYEVWECNRVAEGSATVALRMAEELGHRVRFATPVTRMRVSPQGCSVTTETGERFESEAVVCALPVGPLYHVRVEGVSDERVHSTASVTRSRPRWCSPTRTRSGTSRARTATATSRPRSSAAPGSSARASCPRSSRPSASPRSSPPRRPSSRPS
jgi:monoamine oxidase